MIKKLTMVLMVISSFAEAMPPLTLREKRNALAIAPPATVIASTFCGNFYASRGPRLVSLIGLLSTAACSALFIKKI